MELAAGSLQLAGLQRSEPVLPAASCQPPRGGLADEHPTRRDFTFIVQGITGREAVNLTRECLDYGSRVVGGVTPGRKGREVHGVPVFDTVEQVVSDTGRLPTAPW